MLHISRLHFSLTSKVSVDMDRLCIPSEVAKGAPLQLPISNRSNRLNAVP